MLPSRFRSWVAACVRPGERVRHGGGAATAGGLAGGGAGAAAPGRGRPGGDRGDHLQQRAVPLPGGSPGWLSKFPFRIPCTYVVSAKCTVPLKTRGWGLALAICLKPGGL